MEEIGRTRIGVNEEIYSRYRKCDRIKYDDGTEIIESMNRVVIPRTMQDDYYEVPVEYENRLDLIAYKFYDNPRLWWAIAYASNIIDPFNIPVGTKLRIPPIGLILSGEVL